MDISVASLVAVLREEGSDSTAVEAKRAAGGFPGDLDTTMSAFANIPGGGTVILGLDEAGGFAAVPVYDVVNAQTRLAALARTAMTPPVQVDVSTHVVDGVTVVAAKVHEAPPSIKPVRITRSGKAYLRAYDGDYELSELEVQAFIANRDHPRFDQAVVEGSTVADLDPGLLSVYRETCRTSSSTLARFGDDELLLRTGVVAASGALTTAGLLALGTYPQQYLPNAVIQATVAPRPGDPEGTRASDTQKFDGPLATMLEEATRWVQRNTSTRIRFGGDGHGRDEPEYPTEAVRELISNALVHRDLGPHAVTYASVLRIEQRQLVLSNPGGLWGITTERLGREKISSARNDRLLRIAQNVRTVDGRRVVEAISSGIPAILDSLDRAGMVRPVFYDQGIRFIVRVPNHALLAQQDLSWLAEVAAQVDLSDVQRHALVGMRHGQRWTNSSFREFFPRDSTTARADLHGLVEAGMAIADGERGGRTYSLAPSLVSGGRSRQPSLFDEAAADDEVEGEVREPSEPASRPNTAAVSECLSSGPQSISALIASTGLTRKQVKYAVGLLRQEGRVLLDGRRGSRTSTYRLVDSATPEGSRSGREHPLETRAAP